jgi:hypothetical protein
MVLEISHPIHDLHSGATAHPTRPTPHPISNTSSEAVSDMATAILFATCFPEVCSEDSSEKPVAAKAAPSEVTLRESHTAEY